MRDLDARLARAMGFGGEVTCFEWRDRKKQETPLRRFRTAPDAGDYWSPRFDGVVTADGVKIGKSWSAPRFFRDVRACAQAKAWLRARGGGYLIETDTKVSFSATVCPHPEPSCDDSCAGGDTEEFAFSMALLRALEAGEE